jgi:aryl-alcohol dehydrogenase-like predicted oxidoreductase
VNRGWNCIDTAANYRSGRGEAAVGHALLALRIANVGITRNMLFVS